MHKQYHHLDHYKIESKGDTKRLFIATGLTFSFFIVELIGSFISGSLALFSDSMHMLSDVFALFFAALAIIIAVRPPNERFTFGYLRVEVITAFLSSIALTLISLGIVYKGIMRLISPVEIQAETMIIVASIGFLVNVVVAFLLSRSDRDNVNIRAAFLHFLGDILGSLAIILSFPFIYFLQWNFVDAILSIGIGGYIGYHAAQVIRETFITLMESAPKGMVAKVIDAVKQYPQVINIHEVHLHEIVEGHYILSAHVFVRRGTKTSLLLKAMTDHLQEELGIRHVTLQMEIESIHPHDFGVEEERGSN